MMVDDQSLGGMSELTPSVQPYGNTFDDGDESSSDDGGDGAGDLAAPLPSMTMRGRRASAAVGGGGGSPGTSAQRNSLIARREAQQATANVPATGEYFDGEDRDAFEATFESTPQAAALSFKRATANRRRSSAININDVDRAIDLADSSEASPPPRDRRASLAKQKTQNEGDGGEAPPPSEGGRTARAGSVMMREPSFSTALQGLGTGGLDMNNPSPGGDAPGRLLPASPRISMATPRSQLEATGSSYGSQAAGEQVIMTGSLPEGLAPTFKTNHAESGLQRGQVPQIFKSNFNQVTSRRGNMRNQGRQLSVSQEQARGSVRADSFRLSGASRGGQQLMGGRQSSISGRAGAGRQQSFSNVPSFSRQASKSGFDDSDFDDDGVPIGRQASKMKQEILERQWKLQDDLTKGGPLRLEEAAHAKAGANRARSNAIRQGSVSRTASMSRGRQSSRVGRNSMARKASGVDKGMYNAMTANVNRGMDQSVADAEAQEMEKMRVVPHYDRCKPILDKEPELRTTDECRELLDLVRGFTFFAQFGDEQQLELCHVMQLVHVPFSFKAIFCAGDPGDAFYLIVQGSVYVQVLNEFQHHKTIAHLWPTDTFGEAALQDDAPRNSTILSAEPCELLRINKSDYLKIIRSQYSEKLREKEAFIRKIPCFRGASDEVVHTLSRRINFTSYPVNCQIWAEGDLIDPLHFMPVVRRGEIDVLRAVVPEAQRRKLNAMARRKRRASRIGKLDADAQTAVSGLTSESNAERARQVAEDLEAQAKPPQQMQICVLGPAAAFMEEAMIDPQVLRMFEAGKLVPAADPEASTTPPAAKADAAPDPLTATADATLRKKQKQKKGGKEAAGEARGAAGTAPGARPPPRRPGGRSGRGAGRGAGRGGLREGRKSLVSRWTGGGAVSAGGGVDAAGNPRQSVLADLVFRRSQRNMVIDDAPSAPAATKLENLNRGVGGGVGIHAAAAAPPPRAQNRRKRRGSMRDTESALAVRGSTLITRCACEIGWLSKYIFDVILEHDSTLAQAVLTQYVTAYPRDQELADIHREHRLWRKYRGRLLRDALASTPKAAARVIREMGSGTAHDGRGSYLTSQWASSSSSTTKAREYSGSGLVSSDASTLDTASVYRAIDQKSLELGHAPTWRFPRPPQFECDVVLPYRKPIDYAAFSLTVKPSAWATVPTGDFYKTVRPDHKRALLGKESDVEAAQSRRAKGHAVEWLGAAPQIEGATEAAQRREKDKVTATAAAAAASSGRRGGGMLPGLDAIIAGGATQ